MLSLSLWNVFDDILSCCCCGKVEIVFAVLDDGDDDG